MFSINVLKRSVALMLSVLLLINCLPLTALGETANASIDNGEEYIYYSDLFYGYSQYLDSVSLNNHHFQTQLAMSNVFNEYVNSSAFGWASFSETLNLFSSMSELAKAYTDQFGLTDFQYEDDLDEANKKFVANLFEIKMDVSEGTSKIGKTISQFDGVISTIEKLYKAKETDTLVLAETITLVLEDTSVYCKHTTTFIPSLNAYVLEYLDELSKPLNTASEIFEFAAALATAIAMEDVRIELIKDIINTQDSGSILYEGMSRLYNQLANGYVSYFVETYFTNKIIDDIAKGITKNAQKILLGSINAVCTAVTSCVGLINDIVFDWILGDTLPSFEDYRVTMILAQYSDLLFDSVLHKQLEFKKSFENSQVVEYETLFNAYLSAAEYALKQCADLAYYNDTYTPSYVNEKIVLWCDDYTYCDYITDIKIAIQSIPLSERVLNVYNTWYVETSTTVHNGTDEIEAGYIYSVHGVLNIHHFCFSGGKITIPSNASVTINGNINDCSKNKRCQGYISVEGTMKILGSMTIKETKLINVGRLEVYGDIDVNNFHMNNDNAVLLTTGNINITYPFHHYHHLKGTIVMNGITQQEIYSFAWIHNLYVENPAGIKYKGPLGITGDYFLNGNPLDNNGGSTLIGRYDVRLDSISDYKRIELSYADSDLNTAMTWSLENDLIADIDFGLDSNSIRIPQGADVTIDGNVGGLFSFSEREGHLDNDGTLRVLGNVKCDRIGNGGMLEVRGELDACDFYMNNPDTMFSITGNIKINSALSNVPSINGTVVMNGTEQQEIDCNESIQNLYVENTAGIKYGDSLSITGDYFLNGNPLDNNGHRTRIGSYVKLDSISDYKIIEIAWGSSLSTWTLENDLTADINLNKNSIRVPQSANVTIDGNIGGGPFISDAKGDIQIAGALRVLGNIKCDSIGNGGMLEARGDIDVSDKFTMRNPDAVFSAAGDVRLSDYDSITDGTVIFNGSEGQTVNSSCMQPKKIEILNISDEGVIFKDNITASILFDHHGNNFILYNNGSGSVFVDYDGDGLKDNVDPKPTVGNPCVLFFQSNDAEKGSVSVKEVETVGGTEITVMATPSFKYEFVKWVNSSGVTVSNSMKYTFIAKKDETYTAVFDKRQQPIKTQTDGGAINVPAMAEIESKVSVTVTENEGYVYTEGSLACNNIPVLNNSFIMPDEAVTLTAEFIRNDNYFKLKDMIVIAKSYTYETYSALSFNNLSSAISAAETALVNNITADDSNNHISMLKLAIDNLQKKHITTVGLKDSPTLYVNVPDMINDIVVLVTYDNGTTITVTGKECIINGYNATILGEQSIIVGYGGVNGIVKIDVQKRLLNECIIDVKNQVYDGVKEQYTPAPVVSYTRTEDVLRENIDFTLEYKYNNRIGTAEIIAIGIGNYTGCQSACFEIYCEHNYVCTERVEPTCIEMGYQVEKCTVCGESKTFTNMVTEGLPESEHNYANNSDISYSYTDKGAQSLIIKFSSSTLTENTYDKIYIYDGKDTLLGTYTGSALAGKNIKLEGDTVRIRLTSDGSIVKYGFSIDSITAYFDRLLLSTIEHTYGEWSTVTAATPETVGTKHKLCTECGDAITEEIPMVSKPAFKGASLSLHHNLAINYKVDRALFDEVGYTQPYVVFEVGEVKTTVTEYTIDNERYVFKFKNIAPNQMNEVIYATLYATYNGVEYASETREYSVAEYCYSTLDTYATDEYAELRTLLVDLLHYGAQSQLYTGYNTANLVNANLTDEQLLWGTNEEQTLTNALNTAYEIVENPTAKWKGAGLTLTDSVSMRFKFTTNSIDGLSVKIKSATGEWNITSDKFVEEDGAYYVYFNGLNAGQMSEKVYLTIYDGDIAVSNTVCYSIESYAYEKQNSSIAYLSDLVIAMMRYGNSAHAYIN